MAKLTMLRPTMPVLDTRIAPPPPKVGEAHYGTADHKLWAATVKRRAGGRCQDPEHPAGADRQADDGIADHIHERRDGGAALDLANGLWRCRRCHGRKTMAERAKRMR